MRRDRLPPQGTQPPSPSLSLSLSLSLSFSLFLSLSLSLSHSVTPSVSGTMHQFLMCVAPEPQVFFHPRANRITITTFLDISRSGSRRRRQSRLVSSSSFEREFFSFSSSDSSSFSSPSTCCCYEGYFVPRDGFEYDQNQFRNLFEGHVSYKISDVRRQTSSKKLLSFLVANLISKPTT